MFSFVLHCLLVFGSFHVLTAQVCFPPADAPYCVCQGPNGGMIDLTSLSGSPKLQNVQDDRGQTYTYDPCYGLEDVPQCSHNGKTSSVCQTDSQGTVRSCGLTETAEFRFELNNIVIQYGGGVEGRLSLVTVICDQTKDEPELIAYGDPSYLVYQFDLRTKCACENACERVPRGGKKASGGKEGPIGIVIIVLFILAWPTYFITGALVLKFKFKKEGLDLIPQRTFWISLPGLLKDGFMFTFSPIIKLIKDKTGKGSGTKENQSLMP